MALVLADRVRETTTTAGTGTITLLGAVPSCQSFSVVGNGNTTYYTIVAQSGTEWEVGIGTYTSAGTTLSRDTVLSSSNSGSLVNFSAGTKDVFVDYPAGKAVTTDTLAYPPPIGGTTPAAGTFTTLTATTGVYAGGATSNADLNVYSKGTGSIIFNTVNGAGFKVVDTGSTATQQWQALGSSNAILRSSSTAYVESSGANPINFRTNSGTLQLAVSHTASAVNYVQVTGSATGGDPTYSAQGSDANVSLRYLSRGAGEHRFATNTAGNIQFRVIHGGSSVVNYLRVYGSAAGSAPVMDVAGTDTNIDLALTPKGTGTVVANGPFTATGQTSLGGVAGSESLRVLTAGASPNAYATVQGSSFSTAYFGFGGSATNGNLYFQSKAAGTLTFQTNSNTTQFNVSHTASAVNYVQVTGNATGGGPSISAQGSDSNVSMYYIGKGIGGHVFTSGNSGNIQFVVSNTTSSVNWLQSTGAITGSGVTLSAQGSDTNIDINLVPKGIGSTVYTGGVTINGTLTAQTEVLKGTGNNFFTTTTTFSNFGTSNGTITLSAATTDPFGGTSVYKLVANSGQDPNAGSSAILANSGQVLPLGVLFTQSIYFKAAEFSALRIRNNNTGEIYTFTIGVTPTATAGVQTPALTSVGNGWYRASWTFVTGQIGTLGRSDNWSFRLASTGDGVSGIYVSSPQLEYGATLNAYTPNTTTSALYGGPTLSLLGVAGLGLQSDGSLYVSPAGTGALQAQATTSTATGGNARGANAVDWQTSRSSASQVASTGQSVIGGGLNNSVTAQYGSIAGGYGNSIGSSGLVAAIAGGFGNQANNAYTFIGGGVGNTAGGINSAVMAGNNNTAGGVNNFIVGGILNSGTSATAVTTQSATMNGTTAVTLAASNASIKVGQYITGTSIAGNTYVAAISGTSLTLSTAASGSSTSTLSFYTPHGVVVGGGNNQATGSYSFIGGGGDAGTSANRNVASGDWSTVAGGKANTASGVGAFIGGGGFYGVGATGNTASSTSASVVGGHGNTASGYASTVLGGISNTANGQVSTAGGNYSTTRSINGAFAYSPSNPLNGGGGISQWAVYCLAVQTTDTTATVLRSDTSAAGTTNQVILPNNSAYYFKGSVIANVTGAANGAAWSFEGAIMRGANAASTVLINTVAVNRVAASAGATAWTIALTADTTNGGLAVTVTGAASTTIRWVAKVETTEVTY